MKSKRNLITVSVCLFGAVILINNNAISQGNGNGNGNSNNANGNALKWDKHGNQADTTDFIGTTNPTALKMRTNNAERMRITEEGNIGIGESAPIERVEIEGNLRLSGDIIFSNYEDLVDSLPRFISVDENGRTRATKLNALKQSLYTIDCYRVPDDAVLRSSVIGLTLPSWANKIEDDKQILYTGVSCPTFVGIGNDLPDAILDVTGDARFLEGVRIGNQDGTETALHIENRYRGSGKNMFDKLIVVKDHENNKVLQLDNNGLLRAREIKVDEAAWPDYVFKPNYELMPLNKVKEFIAQNGHLPNVPSAKQIETDGVNLGETARVTMEKVEELTLYMIEQQEQLDQQKELLKQQQELIQAQQELVEKQQQEIDALEVK